MMRAPVVVVVAALLVSIAHGQVTDEQVKEHCSSTTDLLRDKHSKLVWLDHEQLKALATRTVAPRLPSAARIQGEVLVNVVVGKDGRVECEWIVSGHPLIVASVLDAVKEWEFRPQTQAGKPVAFGGTLHFRVNSGFSF